MKRRQFVGALAAAPLLGAPKRKTVAAIVTEYRHYSHADVVIGRLLAGYSPNAKHMLPRTHVVSMYTDQVPNNDMSRDLSARNGFKIYDTIEQAITLGTGKVAVDAVVFVGEHGNYPTTPLGQKQYPRFELMSKILDVLEPQKAKIPIFSDKHLSYDWTKAKTMYDRVKKLGSPFMAGSSIPVTIRTPDVVIPPGARIDAAVAMGNGDEDAYGFHLLESLQCMVERRGDGETGVQWVHRLAGEEAINWINGEGAWSKPLFEAAAQRQPKWSGELTDPVRRPVLFIVQYKDGLKAAGLILQRGASSWSWAGNVNGKLESTYFGLPDRSRPLPHFDGLVWCIEEMIVTGKPVYPVERTLLTTGTLAHLFQSKGKHARVETPELAITYRPPAKPWYQHA
ncbi:MAG: hypothetical protein IT168_17850 [Bryobacterales bacterium]|nr:hypothetical protein [Bryobacterales bacterium]